MKDAVVIGKGMVGKGTMHALGIKSFYSRSEANVKLEDLHTFKYIFLCLPTPTVDGKCDTSATEWYIKEVTMKSHDPIFVVRSTVIPGTCERLSKEYEANIVHLPEFLSEDTWKQDSEWPDLIVVGSNDIKAHNSVMGLLKARFKGAEYVSTDLTTAEMIKYAINNLYALKVVYANQIYDYCERKGIFYDTVKEAMYARKWIARNHLEILNKGGRGAGGKCLQKDLESLAHETGSPLLLEADRLNKIYLQNNPKEYDK